MSSASVPVMGSDRGSAPAADVDDGMFWNSRVVVTAGEGSGRGQCVDERTAAATASRRGSRPVGTERFWPSIPVDRWPRTMVPAQVVGGNRTHHAETAVRRGQR